MFTLDLDKLTPEQRSMVALWERTRRPSFKPRTAHASCGTMVANPYVNHVAVLTGGVGRRQLENYYRRYFIPGQPPDLEIVPISRTVGQECIVDEFVYRCTHSISMEWLLPGVPPTGRRMEIAVVVIVSFEGGKMKSEHIYWDQASVLVQLGLLDPAGLPVAGVEVARKVLDPAVVPSNLLMKRTIGRRVAVTRGCARSRHGEPIDLRRLEVALGRNMAEPRGASGHLSTAGGTGRVEVRIEASYNRGNFANSAEVPGQAENRAELLTTSRCHRPDSSERGKYARERAGTRPARAPGLAQDLPVRGGRGERPAGVGRPGGGPLPCGARL